MHSTARPEKATPTRYSSPACSGQNVDDGRGNVTVALEYSKEKRLRANDRDFAGGGDLASFLDNPRSTRSTTIRTVPDQIPYRDARFWDSGPAGAVDIDFDNFQDFNGDDEPWDFGALPFLPIARRAHSAVLCSRAATARGSINTSGT